MESNPCLERKKWSLTKYATGDVMNFEEPNFLIHELWEALS
jgi:hypothetical protein